MRLGAKAVCTEERVREIETERERERKKRRTDSCSYALYKWRETI